MSYNFDWGTPGSNWAPELQPSNASPSQPSYDFVDQNAFNKPQTFQMPSDPYLGGSDAPRGVYQDGTNYGRPNEQPDQSWFDKLGSGLSRMNFDPSQREGMANVMRGGQAGVGLLGTYLQMQENKKARQAQENALQFMKSQINPQVDQWGGTISSMMANPSGYLGDPVDAANSQGATDAAMRMANRQGRSGLNRDEMLGIQNVRQKSYQDRLKQLIDLYGKGITNNQGVVNAMGNIMSRAPQGDTKAMMSGIGGLFEAGRDINNGGNSMTQQQWDERRKASFNLLGN
jgi:hypothetical protein